ncbi:hypothetical protein N9F22_05920 [Alphaproteobacteria bacterium]|nr:hypothetical protein [Alphaproteobacteria bacterium]
MGDNMTATQQTKSYTEPTFEEISPNMKIAMALISAIAADDGSPSHIDEGSDDV